MNYFELYEIPIAFQIDLIALKKKYFELSRKYHPDFWGRENESEQTEALEKSSAVNKAFNIFQNKNETAKYVLQLKSLLEEEEKYQLPPAFLMEMMELNEQLEDAKMEVEKEGMEKIINEITKIESVIYAPVKEIIENYNDDTTSIVDLLKVKEYYFKKKYLERILATM